MAQRRETGLRRGVGLGLVVSVLFVNLVAAVFVSLGVVADQALGLTPLVFVMAGTVFLLTLLGYIEAITMLPQAGGAAGFARRGLGELPSFLAGWALMLDYLILVVLAAYFAVHYLGSMPEMGWLLRSPADVLAAALLIVGVAFMSMRGVRAGARASVLISGTALVAQVLLAGVGLALLFDADAVGATVDVGRTPAWSGLVFALPIAMIGFTGLESIANHGEEIDKPGRDLPRPLIWSAVVSVFVFVTMSVVALDAQPVRGVGEGAATPLGEPDGWVDRPVIGIVDAFDLGQVTDGALRLVFGMLASGVLFVAASSAIAGVGRVAYTMARNRQAPSMLFNIDRDSGVPRRAIFVMTVVAVLLLLATVSLSDSAVVLAQVYAFGATFTAALAGAAVIRLRFTEPELERPYRAPANVPWGNADVSLFVVAGTVVSIAMWGLVLATHDAARVVGLLWMVAGFVAYATYRVTHGLPLARRADPHELRPLRIDAEAYHRVLVAVRPERGMLYGGGDSELIGLAHKLLEREAGIPAKIGVVLVHELPLTVALDAELGDDEHRTMRRLTMIRDVAARLDLRIASTVARARAAGRAICQEAARQDADVVVLATRAKRRKGDEVFGRTVSYVLRHAPSDVVVLQLPEATLRRLPAGSRSGE